MKKSKILNMKILIFLLVIFLLILTGCGSKTECEELLNKNEIKDICDINNFIEINNQVNVNEKNDCAKDFWYEGKVGVGKAVFLYIVPVSFDEFKQNLEEKQKSNLFKIEIINNLGKMSYKQTMAGLNGYYFHKNNKLYSIESFSGGCSFDELHKLAKIVDKRI